MTGGLDPAARAEKWERDRADAAPLIAELRAAGLEIDDVSDLANGRTPDYRAHLPLLVELIGRCPNYWIREWLVRALAIPAARTTGAPAVLVAEFAEAPDGAESYRWAVGHVLRTVATAKEAPAVLAYLRDSRYGTARQELARVVARLRPPGAFDALVAGLDDPDIRGHCVEALGLLGDTAALPHLEPMASHPTRWIASAAKRAIRRLSKPPKP